MVGLSRKSSEKDLDMALDTSGNLQRGPQSVQVSVPPSMVEHGRVGIPGNFSVLKVRSAEVQNEGTGSVSVMGRRACMLMLMLSCP